MFQRCEGIVLLAKKLAPFPPSFDIHNNNNEIQLDVPNSPPINGDQLRAIVTKLWEDHYPEPLFSWDSVTCIMFRLLTFEEYIPKLILEANADGKSENDLVKQQLAQMGLVRAKLFLQSHHPALVDTLFNNLIQYGNFAATSNTPAAATPSSFDRAAIGGNKKDITRLPANRRKLTRQFLEWMDELVTPLIGLSQDVDVTTRAFEGVPAEYVVLVNNNDSHAAASVTSEWFESDDNIRQCLAILLPLITTSTSGTMWHAPLVTFIKHIRLLNQRLFEMVTTTYDEYSVNKICRVLGIHIRVEPPLSIVPQQQLTEEPMMAVDDIVQHDEPVFEAETPPAPLMETSEPPVAIDEVLYDDAPLDASNSELTSQPLLDAPFVDKLTIQERNDILDHDADVIPSTTVAAVATHFDHTKEQDEIPIPDYFSPKQNVQDVMV